jgi:acyl-coenzyme A thioesterase PaaI-like protein
MSLTGARFRIVRKTIVQTACDETGGAANRPSARVQSLLRARTFVFDVPRSRRPARKSTSRNLQDIYAPNSVCFGCGPKNEEGLRLKSRVGGRGVVADWIPGPSHTAFAGFASGGIISVLLDCNGNWAAASSLMKKRGLRRPPGTVTANYTVTFLKPTPLGKRWRLSAWAERIDGNRVSVRGQLSAGGETTATMSGLFVAVGRGHPAYHRWA